jgi:SAM-dependent methyltransferase
MGSPTDQAHRNPAYAAFHRPRFEFLTNLVRREAKADARILDVGPSPLTAMLRNASAPAGGRVDSLGLEPDGALPNGQHYHFDLNDTQHPDRCRRDLGPYDLVIFAEVLEHLYTAPELVLSYLRGLLAPSGLLVLQTPNAASLRKRVKLALGQNPFERIRVDRSNPGHFREYTRAELTELLDGAGLRPLRSWMMFYFDARFARHEVGTEPPSRIRGTLTNTIHKLLPEPLREGITILARRG